WEEQFCDEPFGNLTGRERVLRLNEKLGLKLSPAEFVFACDSCHQPTEQQYSVLAYESNPLPHSFIQRRHICWKCVETGEFVKSGLATDDGERFVVEMIQNGEIRDWM
ncbi:MAG: hypothetical protein DRQ57_16125, partial [Gammaproteobacteria bacterium]